MARPSDRPADGQQPSPGSSRRASWPDAANRALRTWYRPRRIAYPWRGSRLATGSTRADPFVVLVSEVMLQQTQAARVAAAFEPFIARFPDVGSLARASRADVLRAWGRLGYPRRAVALHRAAQVIVERHGGSVPRDRTALRALPGIGEYTAAAISSLAFGAPIAALDTNVRRIVARVTHGAEPSEIPARSVAEAAEAWLDRGHAAEWNQALMDLGRDVCRPVPVCGSCPLRLWCAFAEAGRTGGRSSRRPAAFEGSMRQLRGSVLAELRARSPRTLGSLARGARSPVGRTTEGIRGLHRDGIVVASPAALEGRVRGRVGLPE